MIIIFGKACRLIFSRQLSSHEKKTNCFASLYATNKLNSTLYANEGTWSMGIGWHSAHTELRTPSVFRKSKEGVLERLNMPMVWYGWNQITDSVLITYDSLVYQIGASITMLIWIGAPMMLHSCMKNEWRVDMFEIYSICLRVEFLSFLVHLYI